MPLRAYYKQPHFGHKTTRKPELALIHILHQSNIQPANDLRLDRQNTMKLRRNGPCWCGSGKKYKNCHLNRAQASPVVPQEVIREEEKAKTKYCLHPLATKDCNGPIVRAHSIQRSGGLTTIACDGHVYTVVPTYGHLLKNDGQMKPRLTGVMDATTFTGFCSRHDSSTFKPIESGAFVSSQEQCFLLGYRALCRSLYAKKFQDKLLGLTMTLDRGQSEAEQVLYQRQMKGYSAGVGKGLEDLNIHKREYDESLLSNDYSHAKYYVIWLDSTPSVLCTGAASPEMDFSGKWVYDPDEFADLTRHCDVVCFTLLATDVGAAAVFTWLGESEKCSQFVDSLANLSDDEAPDAVLRYVFELCEDIAIAPRWWDALSETHRHALLRRVNSGVGWKESGVSCLCDDGIRIASMRVLARSTNLQ
jgi:hypothetical protein